jgi:hypothetical protein
MKTFKVPKILAKAKARGSTLTVLLIVCSTMTMAAAGDSSRALESASTNESVSLSYGMNRIRLTASGIPGLLVRARRDNGNAHGFDVLTIYALATSKEKPQANFLIVPVWGPGGKEQFELLQGGGADCKLRSYRFVTRHGGDTELITAEREYGTSYTDEGTVTFTYYQLKQNPDVQMGRPLYYFESVKTSKAAKPYCDVDVAFHEELGIKG